MELSTNTEDFPETQEKTSDVSNRIRSPIRPVRETIIENYRLRFQTDSSKNINPYKAEPKKPVKKANPYVLGLNRYSFRTARDEAQKARKWLMVNVVKSTKSGLEQNRNVWKNKNVKDLVSKDFILWRVNQKNPYGKWYEQFYKPVEFPYVAILDPRTGEKLQVWHKMDPSDLLKCVEDFLLDYKNLWDRSEEEDYNEENSE
ncbi:hypothetical protein JTE90_018511 [Oedothorax gibbosus]|uniref:UAS domain-containing protein n=1 Tax=Oedothorax gibbosus TaxID=931172 RepID=A0AAV6UZJ9_9ARAC|nr:hypothetical protein JTE90_018511 [Oedothorax gibbosus]